MTKTRRLLLSAAPEWVVAVALLAAAAGLQVYLGAFVRWETFVTLIAGVLSFAVGYLLVIFPVGLWKVAPALVRRQEDQRAMLRRSAQEAGNALCFGLVLTATFFLKLWEPLVRSVSYDKVYEAIDRACFWWLDPLIDWRARSLQSAWVNHLYYMLFIGMFLVSLVVHIARRRSEFRCVLVASLLVQALGGMLYIVIPAAGPFLYHPSANAVIAAAQQAFSAVRHAELAGGVNWARANTGQYLIYGLGAMPSLHAAASFVLLYYAWRHVRWLGVVYTPAFLWILFEAMASRWHYGIDLVVGVALACGCIALANRWMSEHEAARRVASPEEAAVALAE